MNAYPRIHQVCILLCFLNAMIIDTRAFMSTNIIQTKHTLCAGPIHFSSRLASSVESQEGTIEAVQEKGKQKRKPSSMKPLLSSTYKKQSKQNKTRSKQPSGSRGENNQSLLDSLNVTAVPLRPITELVLGSKISGTVIGTSPFGVFIKINYDLKVNNKPGYALLHKSQIQNEEVKDDLATLFQVGQVLQNLRVIAVNYAKGEVSLSMRSPRPKRKHISDFKVGQQVSGKIASIMEYGAFIDIGARVNPLLHISRISQDKISNIRDVLNEGDVVSIRIIQIDEMKKSMSASMLSPEADEYLNRRNRRKNVVTRRKDEVISSNNESDQHTEIEFFQDAIRDLEKTLGV